MFHDGVRAFLELLDRVALDPIAQFFERLELTHSQVLGELVIQLGNFSPPDGRDVHRRG